MVPGWLNEKCKWGHKVHLEHYMTFKAKCGKEFWVGKEGLSIGKKYLWKEDARTMIQTGLNPFEPLSYTHWKILEVPTKDLQFPAQRDVRTRRLGVQ